MQDVLCDYLALTPDPVVLARDDGTGGGLRILRANPAFGDHFGTAPDAAVGHAFAELWDDETRGMIDRLLAAVPAPHGTNAYVDGRSVSARGREVWVSIALTILPVDEGGARSVIASLRDISGLKARQAAADAALQAREAALREQEDRMARVASERDRIAAALDAYPDPFVIYDRDWTLVSCNLAYRRNMAAEPDAIRPGMRYAEVMHCAFDAGRIPEPAVGREAFIDEMMNSTQAGDQVRDLHLGGDAWHRVIRTVTATGDIAILRIDITELLRQRRTAEAAQERLVSCLDAYPDPIVIYDADMVLVTCNLAYRRHMAADPAEIRPGMTFAQVVHCAFDAGKMPEPPQGRDAFVADWTVSARAGDQVRDFHLGDDVHHRIIRTVTETGDLVIIRSDISELVRQRRWAQEAQERLSAAMDAYPDPFVIYDGDLKLVTCNTAYRQHMSPDPDALRPGLPFRDVLDLAIANGAIEEPEDGRDAFVEQMRRKFADGNSAEDVEVPGDIHHRLLRNVAENGDFVILRMDVTELVRQRRDVEASKARLLSALDAYPAPFSIYDRDNKLVVCNAAYREATAPDPDLIRPGMDLVEVQRLLLSAGRVRDAVGREEEWLRDVMRQAEETEPSFDVALADGVHHRVLRSRAPNGDLILVRIDMTEVVRQQRILEENARSLEEANQEITRKAFHDELTSLGNRRFLSDHFQGLLRRHAEGGGELTALHMDLDRFKAINDTIGHAAGDHVLCAVAARMLALVREEDAVARIGGDEFVILFWDETPSERGLDLGYRLVEAMAQPVMFEGRECRFGASVGIARTPVSPPADLLINSDIALYKAKRAGRAQVGVFDMQDVVEMRARKALADDIERALEQSEFVPFFQPQIDAVTGEVAGVEALARWQHPTRGILAPDAFLEVAEELDVVARIDRMIFDKALAGCLEAFAARDVYPSLAFNVSGKRIEDGGFDDVASRVRDYPGEIAFELLETIFLEEETDGFLLKLDQLRDMGITIEVDDFGSGRASVVALQKIAPDRLKIDRRLVLPMTEGENAARLVRSIIEIGNALNIGLTAEGVETEEHARLLAEMGVERLQGFHFARPMGLEDLRAFLEPARGVVRADRPSWFRATGQG